MLRHQEDLDEFCWVSCQDVEPQAPFFIKRQLLEIHLVKKRDLFYTFLDLEKAFDLVRREFLWWDFTRRTRVVCYKDCTINV